MADEIKYQGETIRLEWPVLDAEGTPAVLTSAICRLIYQRAESTPVEVDVTPVGNLLSYDITPEVSAALLEGWYQYAFWVRDGADQDKSDSGAFLLQKGPGALVELPTP